MLSKDDRLHLYIKYFSFLFSIYLGRIIVCAPCFYFLTSQPTIFPYDSPETKLDMPKLFHSVDFLVLI